MGPYLVVAGADVDFQVARVGLQVVVHYSTRRNAVVAPDNRMECYSDDRNPDNYLADTARVHPEASASHNNLQVAADRPEDKDSCCVGVRVGRPCCYTSCGAVDPWVDDGAGNFPEVHQEVHPAVLQPVDQLAKEVEAEVQQMPFSTVLRLVEVDFRWGV